MREHRLLLLLSVRWDPSMVLRRPGATWSHSQLSTLSSTKKDLHYNTPESSFRSDNHVGSKGTSVTNIAPCEYVFSLAFLNIQSPVSQLL